MKRLLLATVSIIIWALTALPQTSPCPFSVSVTGPSGLRKSGETTIFTAELSKNAENLKVEYFWTVSSGKIIEGQGTPRLSVVQSPQELGMTVTATVEIKVLSENCSITGSATGEIICFPVRPKKIDEFSVPPPRIRKERLEMIALELANDPTATAYIEESFSREVSSAVIRAKLSKTFLYLTQTIRIQPERIVWQVFGGQENLTTFWIIPAGADLPDSDEKTRQIRGENFQNQLNKLFLPTSKKKKPSSKSP